MKFKLLNIGKQLHCKFIIFYSVYKIFEFCINILILIMHVILNKRVHKTFIRTIAQRKYKFSFYIKKISLKGRRRMKQVKEIGYEDYRQCTLFFILKRNLTILITFQMSIIIV